MKELDPGEFDRTYTRVGGGVKFTRDKYCHDGFQIDEHGGELYREEIKELAEAAGFEVTEK